RGVDFAQRDALEQRVHVLPMTDRDPRLADFARRDRGIRVVAVLARKIESDRKTALAGFQIFMKPRVRLARITEAGVGANDPRLPAGPGFLASLGFTHRFARGRTERVASSLAATTSQFQHAPFRASRWNLRWARRRSRSATPT